MGVEDYPVIEGVDVKWLWRHLRPFSNSAVFPREVLWLGSLYPKRKTVNSFDEYYEWLVNQAYKDFGLVNVYVSFFSMYQQSENVFDAVLVDVDAPQYIDEVLKRLNGLPLDVWFTGRGYHVVVLFNESVKVSNWSLAVDAFLKQYGLEKLVDVAPSKDKRRVVRIPGTVNRKTGERMVFVKHVDGDPAPVIEIFQRAYPPPMTEYTGKRLSVSSIPMCVSNMLSYLSEFGELAHEARVFLANFLLKWGLSTDEVHSLFERFANDYDPGKTSKQIESIALKNYKLHNCDRVMSWGFCPFAQTPNSCPYYPSLNKFLV